MAKVERQIDASSREYSGSTKCKEFNARGNDEIEIYEGVFDPPQSNTGRNRRTFLMLFLCLR